MKNKLSNMILITLNILTYNYCTDINSKKDPSKLGNICTVQIPNLQMLSRFHHHHNTGTLQQKDPIESQPLHYFFLIFSPNFYLNFR